MPYENPYVRFADRELQLNDELAIERTILANERSLLAYGRTSLALLAIGGSSIRFFAMLWTQLVGAAFITAAIIVMLYGWMRYRKMRDRLSPVLRRRDASNATES